MKMNEFDFYNPSDEFMRSIRLSELLPQKPPFVMIDCLTHYEKDKVVSETTIRETNIYVEHGVMQGYGLIENIAQTCAARIGYINKYILKQGIQIGYIGSLKNLTIESLPHTGDVITTEVTVQDEILGMILAKAIIRKGNQLLVNADLKIALKS